MRRITLVLVAAIASATFVLGVAAPSQAAVCDYACAKAKARQYVYDHCHAHDPGPSDECVQTSNGYAPYTQMIHDYPLRRVFSGWFRWRHILDNGQCERTLVAVQLGIYKYTGDVVLEGRSQRAEFCT